MAAWPGSDRRGRLPTRRAGEAPAVAGRRRRGSGGPGLRGARVRPGGSGSCEPSGRSREPPSLSPAGLSRGTPRTPAAMPPARALRTSVRGRGNEGAVPRPSLDVTLVPQVAGDGSETTPRWVPMDRRRPTTGGDAGPAIGAVRNSRGFPGYCASATLRRELYWPAVTCCATGP